MNKKEHILNNALIVFLGSGIGGLFRYWISGGIHILLGKQFPYGTLIVNVNGCFLMGILFVLMMDLFDDLSLHLKLFLLVGFLGGYTTFSSFTIETINLIITEGWGVGLMNILLNVSICLAATWIGLMIGKILPYAASFR